MARKLRIATRGSQLALWQTHHLIALLGLDDVEIVEIRTEGDRTQKANIAIEAMRGRGVFVKEVQAAVLDGRADIASHSAKDLPSTTDEGLVLACIPERGDPRDALVGKPLDELPSGSIVGTGSVRRRAQLASLRPDLTFANLRGNVDTRLEKAKDFDAIVVAYAPLLRLERTEVNPHVLEPSTMLPQVGQGALAAECRDDDEEVHALLKTIEHAPSRRAVDAERSFLAALGGGCDLPVGGYATIDESGKVHLRGLIASLDGHVVLRHAESGDDPDVLGKNVASVLLDDAGGRALLQR